MCIWIETTSNFFKHLNSLTDTCWEMIWAGCDATEYKFEILKLYSITKTAALQHKFSSTALSRHIQLYNQQMNNNRAIIVTHKIILSCRSMDCATSPDCNNSNPELGRLQLSLLHWTRRIFPFSLTVDCQGYISHLRSMFTALKTQISLHKVFDKMYLNRLQRLLPLKFLISISAQNPQHPTSNACANRL